MISIKPNQQWKNFDRIYGRSDIVRRYYWFLFEFGKRASRLFHRQLGETIEKKIGDKEYKKRLVVAEMRDKGSLAWWAVVGSAKGIGEFDPSKTIFQVAARFRIDDDPVREILENFGPWTTDTIPFVPSRRAAIVIAKEVSEKEVQKQRKRIQDDWNKIKSKLVVYGIAFEDRIVVHRKLRVVRDIDVDALRYEFVSGDSHWRPSLRWIRKQGIKKLEKEKDLIRVWVDPKFAKYRVFRHFRIKLTQAELKRIQSFQDKVRQG